MPACGRLAAMFVAVSRQSYLPHQLFLQQIAARRALSMYVCWRCVKQQSFKFAAGYGSDWHCCLMQLVAVWRCCCLLAWYMSMLNMDFCKKYFIILNAEGFRKISVEYENATVALPPIPSNKMQASLYKSYLLCLMWHVAHIHMHMHIVGWDCAGI